MGILLPGHRFDVFGFLDPKYGLPPLTELEENLLPVRTSGFPCKKIRKLLCYMDDHAFSAWLANIDPANADSLASKTGSTDVIVRVNGYVCPGLYSAMQTMKAEYLELRLLDVRGSRFSVRPVRRAEMETRKEPWTNAINRAVGKTIKIGIQVPGTREFMNSIFSELGEPALTAPGGTLEDIVRLMADAKSRLDETRPVSDGNDLHRTQSSSAGPKSAMAGKPAPAVSAASSVSASTSPPASAPRVTRTPRVRAPAATQYELSVVLNDVEPPVERLLLVAGLRSLNELHDIFQCAMGWNDGHLHLFRIRDKQYGEYSPDVFMEMEDETAVSLASLKLKAGDVFSYVYDFGDDWVHTVTVQSVKPDPERKALMSQCLSGRGASPPEDCGGVPGFMGLLEALALPPEKRTQYQEDLVSWAGRWKPDSFNRATINRRLKKL